MRAAWLVLLLASPSAAYHPLADYGLSANDGGGGSMYFTGSPRWRGYDCTICHVDAPGLVRFEVTSDPPELFASGVWTPGREYTISIAMVGETRRSDTERNTFVLGVEDDAGRPMGSFGDPNGDLQPVQGAEHGASSKDGNVAGKAGKFAEWSFRFKAPAAGAGRLSFYLGGVDGDGGATAASPRPPTDPLGDDLYLAKWRVCESGAACDRSFQERPEVEGDEHARPACSAAPHGARGAALLVLAVLLGLRRRRVAMLALVLVACADPTLPAECPGRICGDVGGAAGGDAMAMGGGFTKMHQCACDACKEQTQCVNHCKDFPKDAATACYVEGACWYGTGSCP